MANNRMIIVCNHCYPTDEWKYDDDICYIAKWYPVGAYYTNDVGHAGKAFYAYLERHAHTEEFDGWYEHQENPVRLTYETWLRDMPAIKKWVFKKEKKK